MMIITLDVIGLRKYISNLPFPNLMCFHVLNYREVHFNSVFLLRLPSCDLLWHTLRRGFFLFCFLSRTGFHMLHNEMTDEGVNV